MKRLAEIEQIIIEKNKIYGELHSKWVEEKDRLIIIKKRQEDLEKARRELEVAIQTNDFARASELKHSEIPRLQEQSDSDSEFRENQIISESVRSKDVCFVISKATGIPVHQLLTSEREKLLQMEDHLTARIKGQDPALRAISDVVRVSRAGLHNHKYVLLLLLLLFYFGTQVSS